MTGVCPICDRPTPQSARYPTALCRECVGRAADVNGLPLTLQNTGLMGTGFQALYADGTVAQQPTQTGVVWVEGVRCRGQEGYFGGIVVVPDDA
jgi:hypothetical protein